MFCSIFHAHVFVISSLSLWHCRVVVLCPFHIFSDVLMRIVTASVLCVVFPVTVARRCYGQLRLTAVLDSGETPPWKLASLGDMPRVWCVRLCMNLAGCTWLVLICGVHCAVEFVYVLSLSCCCVRIYVLRWSKQQLIWSVDLVTIMCVFCRVVCCASLSGSGRVVLVGANSDRATCYILVVNFRFKPSNNINNGCM